MPMPCLVLLYLCIAPIRATLPLPCTTPLNLTIANLHEALQCLYFALPRLALLCRGFTAPRIA